MMAGSRKRSWLAATAFVPREEQAREVMRALVTAGVPRDLIDVVVSERTVKHLSKELRAKPHSHTFSMIGRGALFGLIAFSIVSLLLIATSWAGSNPVAIFVMLLGPNMGVLFGGVVGFIVGKVIRPQLPMAFARALERDELLLVVRSSSEQDAQRYRALLERSGGVASLVTPLHRPKPILGFFLVFMIIGLRGELAFAHSYLTATDPPAQSVLKEVPSHVQLTFSAPIEPRLSHFRVRHSAGVVALKPHFVSMREVRLPLNQRDAGGYVVEWSIVASDGHRQDGALEFHVVRTGS